MRENIANWQTLKFDPLAGDSFALNPAADRLTEPRVSRQPLLGIFTTGLRSNTKPSQAAFWEPAPRSPETAETHQVLHRSLPSFRAAEDTFRKGPKNTPADDFSEAKAKQQFGLIASNN